MAQTPLTMPVLSIAGEKASAAILGPQMKRVATNVEVIVLKDTGHWLMEERPKETMADRRTHLHVGNDIAGLESARQIEWIIRPSVIEHLGVVPP
jgi:hypothetical protein